MSAHAARSPLASSRLWIGIVVSVICVWLVSRRVNWTSVGQALAAVDVRWLAGAALVSASSQICSGFRWRQVISPEVALPVREACDAVLIGNLASVAGPARAGDLARAALVARRRSILVSRALGAIVVERYADVLMLIALAAGLSMTVNFPGIVRTGVIAFAVGGVAAGAAVAIAAGRLPAAAGYLAGMFVRSWGPRMASFTANVVSGIRGAAHWRQFPGTLAWSVLVWALAGAAVWCNLKAFSLPVPWYAAFFVLLVVNLGGAIPASPGSIGVYHYLAMTALSVWVADANVALGVATLSHATGIVVMTVLGLTALAIEHESLFGVERAAQVALDDMRKRDIR